MINNKAPDPCLTNWQCKYQCSWKP